MISEDIKHQLIIITFAWAPERISIKVHSIEKKFVTDYQIIILFGGGGCPLLTPEILQARAVKGLNSSRTQSCCKRSEPPPEDICTCRANRMAQRKEEKAGLWEASKCLATRAYRIEESPSTHAYFISLRISKERKTRWRSSLKLNPRRCVFTC